MSERVRADSRASYRSSRPASALSSSSQTTHRPASSSSLHAQPRPPQHPKTPKPSAARYGGLAERDLQKLQSSIRAASKTAGTSTTTYKSRHEPLREADEEDEAARADPAPEGSFIAETSFSRAPVNSRLPHLSPHRVAGQPAAQQQLRKPADARDDSDDISDSGSTIEDAEEDEETRIKKEKARRRKLGLDKESLSGLSAELQEALMTEDLLSVLMGIEGRYIEYDTAYTPEDDYERLQGAHFVIDAGLDPRIATLVQRFLPLATYYTGATAFVQEYSVLEHGTVNHALCAAIREMLRDYLVLLARLEEQFNSSSSFTLQRFWLLVHPALNTLSLLHALTTEIVALSVPSPDDESENGSDAEESDDGYGAGLGDVLAELNAATAAARPASAAKQATWRFGPSLGGETLHLLSSLLTRTAGNPSAKSLYAHLLLRASQPYAHILLGWISTGRLDDRWDEFCVREQRGFSTGTLDADYTDEYWERRYTLRDRTGERAAAPGASAAGKAPVRSALAAAVDDRPRERGLAGGAVVPGFLEPWADKILLAGKYLNVIRECGIEVEVPHEAGEGEDGMVDMQEESFYKRIDAAYTYANKTLLKLLLEEEHLVSRLETIKQYFFINHGDVFTHFLDMAEKELGKRKRRIMLERLQTQLDLALLRAAPPSAAGAAPDAFKDDLRIVFEDVTVAEWLLKVVNQTGAMVGPDGVPVDALESGKKPAADKQARDPGEHTGWDVFNLDYSLSFPLSLVLSRRSITFYQMIFRHLLRLRHLERVFQDTWTEHLKTPAWRRRSPYPELQAWKGRVFALRARMYDFIQQMFDFAVSEVLEVRWAELRAKLEKCETVDQLLRDHDDFLNTCTNECLLTNEKLLDLFHQRLFNTCYVYANYTSSFTKIVVTSEAQANGDWGRLGGEFKKHWEFLSRFEIHFNHHISQALSFLQLHAARENSGILPLIVRLSSLKMDDAGKGAVGAGR
ncbi:gamma tubulin complex Spc97/GCP2 subunit Alp4 [Rhodotorula kratochvilovae]